MNRRSELRLFDEDSGKEIGEVIDSAYGVHGWSLLVAKSDGSIGVVGVPAVTSGLRWEIERRRVEPPAIK